MLARQSSDVNVSLGRGLNGFRHPGLDPGSRFFFLRDTPPAWVREKAAGPRIKSGVTLSEREAP